MIQISEIISAIEEKAPLNLQEQWDNSGLQLGPVYAECTGVVVCVDVTAEVVDYAVAQGCNLIVSHHPLIFRPVKVIDAESLIYRAIRAGLTVYSAHTSLDNAPDAGISHAMADAMGLTDVAVLAPIPGNPEAGTGVIGLLKRPMRAEEFVHELKQAFGLVSVRCSVPDPEREISRVAAVGGAGGSFITEAIAAGADAMVTGDIRHHDFVDHCQEIFMVDITHFDSEKCAKEIIMRIISEKFPNFAALKPGPDSNPINYL